MDVWRRRGDLDAEDLTEAGAGEADEEIGGWRVDPVN
jgi:hypothetical protein